MLTLKERSQRLRLRIFLVALFGFATLVVGLAVAVQFDQVAELFSTRHNWFKNTIRHDLVAFARYGLGLDIAIQRLLVSARSASVRSTARIRTTSG